METYKIDMSKKWDYENGFYLSCETGRIAKLISHLEIYKKIYMVDEDGEVAVDHVFRLEHIVEDLGELASEYKLDKWDLKISNTSKHKPYQEYYTNQDMIDKVAEFEAPIIALYNYKFND